MAKLVSYRLPKECISPTLQGLAKVIHNHILVHEDWEGLQLTVMRDGTITYDIQAKGGE